MPIPIDSVINAIKSIHDCHGDIGDYAWRLVRNEFLTSEGVGGILVNGERLPLPEFLDAEHTFWFEDLEKEILFVLKWS